MTKTLKTLIKLHKHYLDTKRRELTILEESRDQIVNSVRRMDIEFIAEQEFTAKEPQKYYTYEKYAANVRLKKHQAAQRIKALDKEITILSDQISEAFGELKKFDILKNIKEEEAQKELQRKFQIDLDEIGGIAYQRRKENA